jgi:hypothetical protein
MHGFRLLRQLSHRTRPGAQKQVRTVTLRR